MNAVLGAKDEPRYLMGGIGEVRGQLEAEQDQRQGHLHLNHGKLLPNAVPGERAKAQVEACKLMRPAFPVPWVWEVLWS